MWFCQKCNKWYDDSVAILKHIQNLHPSDAARKSGPCLKSKMKMQLPKSLPSSKPNIEKLVMKKQKKESCTNGVIPPSELTVTGPFKIMKKDKPKDVLKNHSYNSPYSEKKPTSSDKKNSMTSDQYMVIGNINEKGSINKVKTYICKFCCRKFDNSDRLQLHLKSHQSNPKHACHMCGMTAGTFSALMAHYVKHSGMKTESSKISSENKMHAKEQEKRKNEDLEKRLMGIPCNQCKKNFQTRKAFNTHYCPPQNDKTEYVCAYCRQVTFSVEEYRDHIQSHSPSLQFACKYCSRKFGHKFQLQQHIKACIHRTIKTSTQKKALNPQGFLGKPSRSLLKTNVSTSTTKLKCNAASSSSSTAVKSLMNFENDCLSIAPVLPSEKMSKRSPGKGGNIHSRLRPKTAKVTYSAESSPEDSSAPTRRSARLVNRRHSTQYSRASSESESAETFQDEESPTPLNSISASSSTTSSPKKAISTNSPKKAISLNSQKKSTSLYSPKKAISLNSPKKANSLNSPTKAISLSSPKKAIPLNSPKKEEEEPTIPQNPEIILKIPKKNLKLPSKKTITLLPMQKDISLSAPENKTVALCCNLCSLLFRSKGSLKRHKKMHSGKPQFVCQYCGKFFYRRDIHRRHEGNVHMSAASQLFVCYYCKKMFDTSAELKEHAFSFHSGRALVPERIRRCTPKKKRAESDVFVKAEQGSSFDDTSLDLEEELPLSYNCGSCNNTFEDSPSLVRHFDQVHKSANDNEQSKIPKQSILNEIVDRVTPIQEMSDFSSMNISQDSEMENTMPTYIPWAKSNDNCELCFTKLPDMGMMMCSEKDVHKAIDWYQCSICALFGQKQQMQEHMLTHMTKVGTFVVNIKSSNFNEINGYLSQNSKIEDLMSSNTVQPWESVQTLMDEIHCCHCNEVIIDLCVLLQHPCMERNNEQFACFVKDCSFVCEDIVEVQNHLQNFHCTAIAIDEEEDNISNITHCNYTNGDIAMSI